eukprot:350796-Chlamydomonas_euryale.AAC.2
MQCMAAKAARKLLSARTAAVTDDRTARPFSTLAPPPSLPQASVRFTPASSAVLAPLSPPYAQPRCALWTRGVGARF